MYAFRMDARIFWLLQTRIFQQVNCKRCRKQCRDRCQSRGGHGFKQNIIRRGKLRSRHVQSLVYSQFYNFKLKINGINFCLQSLYPLQNQHQQYHFKFCILSRRIFNNIDSQYLFHFEKKILARKGRNIHMLQDFTVSGTSKEMMERNQ